MRPLIAIPGPLRDPALPVVIAVVLLMWALTLVVG